MQYFIIATDIFLQLHQNFMLILCCNNLSQCLWQTKPCTSKNLTTTTKQTVPQSLTKKNCWIM